MKPIILPPLPRPVVPPVPRGTPTVVVIGEGVAVVMVGNVIRIDVTADDGVTRCTRFVTIEEARQLNVALARLCK